MNATMLLFYRKWLIFGVLLLSSTYAWGQHKLQYRLSMVHNNPGEPLTTSVFNAPAYLAGNGYTGQVVNEFAFVHAAVTFDKLNPQIFPVGSVERGWVLAAADKVRQNIRQAHQAGIKVYYFTDLIVLPKKLVALYHDELCDAQGRISFERPKTVEVHRLMLQEVFETFPDLDGLVIRTGETYLNNVPYHTGNGPITNGPASHIKLINLLREEVCVKRHKMVFYRTWSFGGMHDDAAYYLTVTNQIAPHANLVFSVKHTKGDYHRTFDFNPTLGIGRHPQVAEVQCQREYEGKGAYPNYVMNGVINGFEEYRTTKPQPGKTALRELVSSPVFRGVWAWPRGGGWVGPYIKNEFWCRLNAFVLTRWSANTALTEEQVFNQFMDENGIAGASREKFRRLCLLSAQAVLRGHDSAVLPFANDWAWWMRDEFLAGISPADPAVTVNTSEGPLYTAFTAWYGQGLLPKAVAEKYEAVALWQEIADLSQQISLPSQPDQQYLLTSATYGLRLHQIIATGWEVMALGFVGDKTGTYDKAKLSAALKGYDAAWSAFQELKAKNQDCASLYQPYAFLYQAPDYHGRVGMAASVDKYRALL